MIETTKKEEKKFQSFKKGDENGFNFFFNEHYAVLTFFAFKIIGNKIEAEDVVQDSFVKLWEKREILEKPGSIKAYLYTTVKNASIDLINKRKKSSEHTKSFAFLQDTSEQSILYKMIEAEVIRCLMVSKETLPTKAKQVLEMFYFEHKSYQEIAEKMNISIHTVKNQKIRAIKHLRKQFPYILLFLYYLEQGKG